MAIRGVDFKWYDGFFLSMLATSIIIVAINWKRYHYCQYPLHIWIVVDYTTVFVFRLLMFVDNGLASGMGLDFGWQQRYARFCGRVVVLSILSLLLYPFLWAWTIIGTIWFTSARDCLPEEGQKWGFLIWLLFSYCGLLCIACMSMGKWLTRRQAHLLRAQQGIPISEYGVLVDMIIQPSLSLSPHCSTMKNPKSFFLLILAICFSLLITKPLAFQFDELLADDEEFGIEGGKSPDLDLIQSSIPPPKPTGPTQTTQKRHVDRDSDSNVQFSLEHAFGDSEFSPAGTFSTRVKTWSHGGQTLMKLRFSRNDLTGVDKENFKKLLEGDDFYRIRVPSNVISPPGRDYIISSVKARCLSRNGLDEHFIVHMDGVNILAVNYGSPGACQYPRPLKIPAKWAFTSHTVLKNSEQAPRTPAFSEDIGGVEIGGEDEGVKPLERSLWAKYWMYLIPLGLIVMNAVTQTMNMPEEQAGGQPASQTQQPIGATPHGPSTTVRRR